MCEKEKCLCALGFDRFKFTASLSELPFGILATFLISFYFKIHLFLVERQILWRRKDRETNSSISNSNNGRVQAGIQKFLPVPPVGAALKDLGYFPLLSHKQTAVSEWNYQDSNWHLHGMPATQDRRLACCSSSLPPDISITSGRIRRMEPT